jgi:hypothetical protein
MNIKHWSEFVDKKSIELMEVSQKGEKISEYAVMWTLINIFRFLMDWYDEWKKEYDKS